MTGRYICLIAIVILLAAGSARGELLDGTKWKVTVTPNAAAAAQGEQEFTDELTFANGKFTSAALTAKGYKSAAYTSEDEGYEIEFEAELVHDSEGRANWSGGVTNKEITGRLQYIRKDKTRVTFDFTGKRL